MATAAGSLIVATVANHSKTETFHSVLSDSDRRIFELVNFVTICGLVSLFGITANIINIIIFYKQGFTNTANIAFLGLAVSDLCCLLALEWSSICISAVLPGYEMTWIAVEVTFLTGAWPHVCFCRITCCITVYITAERFISIAWPLKVKQFVTKQRAASIIGLIYIANIIALLPEYSTSYLGWKFYPERNRSLVGIIFTSSRNEYEGLVYVLHSLISATSFISVIIFTFALVIKLRQTTEWRKEAACKQGRQVSTSTKERRTVKMVVLIASVLIVCYIPSAILATTAFIVGPDFDIKGRHINICEAAWSTAHCFQSINSSVNIFLYYRMSSKYRQTFKNNFAQCLK